MFGLEYDELDNQFVGDRVHQNLPWLICQVTSQLGQVGQTRTQTQYPQQGSPLGLGQVKDGSSRPILIGKAQCLLLSYDSRQYNPIS